MTTIPLWTFVDFCSSTGAARVKLARDHKLARGYDFYRSLTEVVRGMHERAGTLRPEVAAEQLPELLKAATSSDHRKAAIYPTLATGYVTALRELGPTTWTPIAPTSLPLNGVEILVAPELGLVVGSEGGRRCVLTVSWPGEPLSQQRAALAVLLMRAGLPPAAEGDRLGVLDAPRGRILFPDPKMPSVVDLGRCVRGDAAAFETIWAGL